MILVLLILGLIWLVSNFFLGIWFIDDGLSGIDNIRDYIEWMFENRNWFGCICSGILVVLSIPGMLFCLFLTFIFKSIQTIWKLGNK